MVLDFLQKNRRIGVIHLQLKRCTTNEEQQTEKNHEKLWCLDLIVFLKVPLNTINLNYLLYRRYFQQSIYKRIFVRSPIRGVKCIEKCAFSPYMAFYLPILFSEVVVVLKAEYPMINLIHFIKGHDLTMDERVRFFWEYNSNRISFKKKEHLHSTASMLNNVLVQIIACRLFGTKQLSKPMYGYCLLTLGIKFLNFNQNTKFIIHEKAYGVIVCQNGGHFVQGEMS